MIITKYEMGSFRFILKTFAVLIGLPFTLLGFFGFLFGIYCVFTKGVLIGILMIVGAILFFGGDIFE